MTAHSSDPGVQLRAALQGSANRRMIVVPRSAVEALVQGQGVATGGGVFLTLSDDDVERLARAAWETATDPSYVDEHGPWGSNHTDHADHHRAAARRVIATLIEWIEKGSPA